MRFHERRNNFAVNHQINTKFKCQGHVGICEIELISLSCQGQIEGRIMVNREEGAAMPNQRQGQEQPHLQDAVRQRHIHLNWSNFKPEFSGKPEEDAEAHLLCSNDWMESHHFDAGIRVQRFCLTLLGEARLWYHSLEPLGETTWAQLQNLFRQRYTKLDNTHKQLFHAWRLFTFDENTETIGSYVIRIRQVANLLAYGELHILEVFKNTLPTKLYWILFPIEDLRQAVDTAKRILTKEKLDMQLTGQNLHKPIYEYQRRDK